MKSQAWVVSSPKRYDNGESLLEVVGVFASSEIAINTIKHTHAHQIGQVRIVDHSKDTNCIQFTAEAPDGTFYSIKGYEVQHQVSHLTGLNCAIKS